MGYWSLMYCSEMGWDFEIGWGMGGMEKREKGEGWRKGERMGKGGFSLA